MKKHILSIVLGIVGVIVVALVIAGVWLYTGKFNSTKATAFKKLPLPVASVDGQAISGREFLSRLESAQAVYQNGQNFKLQEAQAKILNQLIDELKLRNIAAQYNIKASPEAIETEYQGIVDQYASGDENKLQEMLAQTYHIDPQEFKDKALAADVLRINLAVWHNSQKDLNKAAYDKQQQLIAMLDQGQTFEAVVKGYTEDEATKDFGGDIGTVKLTELASEFRQPLLNAQSGDRILVVSRYGLHIVKVVEVNKTAPETTYHLQQLFIQAKGFEEWYTQQAQNLKVRKLIKF